MARCGCNTAQSTTCEAIMSCIAANLGPGLDYNEATGNLDLRLSTDAGNAAQIGSDGGLYAPPAQSPGPIPWRWTVDTLPAQVMSSTGGGNTVGPSTSPELVEYAIAQGIEMYTSGFFALADEVAYEYIGASNRPINHYTDNPSDLPEALMGATQTLGISYDAGTRESPTSRFSGAPGSMLQPDGGWAGLYYHPFRARTVAEMLRQIRGRAVVELFCERNRSDADSMRDVQAAVAAVVAAGAQDWTIISVNSVDGERGRTSLADLIQVVTDAGITPGVNLYREDQIDTPWEPGELVAAGAQWVVLGSPERIAGLTEERITEFVAAGLQVSAATGCRQYWTERMFALGCRAVRSGDPVYARGGRGQPGDLDYRQDFIPGLETGTSILGGLTPVTDRQTAVFDAGFARSDMRGRWFPARYGWINNIALSMNNQVLGTICPIPNVTDYRIRMRIWRPEAESSLSQSQYAGIFFAALDDRNLDGDNGYAEYRRGYSARVNPPTAVWPRMQLRRHDDSSPGTTLATSTAGPGWGFAAWTDLEITVQGPTLTFTASGAGGSATITATDETYRGPYAFYIWHETTQRPIVHGYDNPTDRVMYEPLS